MSKTEPAKVPEAEGSSPPSPEEIKALVLADRQARESRATEKVKRALEEERCVMNPKFTFSSLEGLKAITEIVAVD